MKFIDEAKIYIKSGSGGAGSISFRREKFIPKGGPDGGDGGKGGSVIFVADKNMGTLLDFKYISRYIAKNGGAGAGKCCTGADGNDCLIKIPPGTLVKDLETKDVLADIDEVGKEYLALKGGRGGKGNTFFKSSTNQTPRMAQPGEKGEEKEVLLELKLLADVGILGKPNAGKSTLISKVSAARPKIADYPFTTIAPNLGVVRGTVVHSFVMADIPGLIEGAHKGKGLGLKFLRHVERAKILIHILDPTLKEYEEIIKDYENINSELQNYKNELSLKKQIVVVNKIDVGLDQKIQKNLEMYFHDKNKKVYFISAISGQGIKDLLFAIEREIAHDLSR